MLKEIKCCIFWENALWRTYLRNNRKQNEQTNPGGMPTEQSQHIYRHLIGGPHRLQTCHLRLYLGPSTLHNMYHDSWMCFWRCCGPRIITSDLDSTCNPSRFGSTVEIWLPSSHKQGRGGVDYIITTARKLGYLIFCSMECKIHNHERFT